LKILGLQLLCHSLSLQKSFPKEYRAFTPASQKLEDTHLRFSISKKLPIFLIRDKTDAKMTVPKMSKTRTIIMTLLLSALPVTAISQVPTRPGTDNDIPAPIVLPSDPDFYIPEQQEQPLPQTNTAPVPRGGFQVIEKEPPSVEDVFVAGQAVMRNGMLREAVPYIRHYPGGPFSVDGEPIVIVAPPGADLFQSADLMNLRREARLSGRALIVMNAKITRQQNSTRLEDRIENALETQDDPENTMRAIEAVLQAERLYDKPTIVGLEGTGTIFQNFLCQDRTSTRQPEGLFLFESTLKVSEVAGCRPPRLPSIVLYRQFDNATVPYDGGEVTPEPGTASPGRVLGASANRSFWALAADCETTPKERWIGISDGRLLMEEHQQCRRGGPVVLLTALETELADEQKSILVETYLNGNLFD
jgi:hypothetical protein